jgi:Mor family transcriptional regulator
VSVDLPRSKIEELIKNGIPDINKDEILCNKIMKIVSQRCGYMVAERLIVNFPGERILIPKNSFMDFKKKYIEKNFNGTNIIELALLLEVSEIFVRKTIAEMYYKKQMVSLFDA